MRSATHAARSNGTGQAVPPPASPSRPTLRDLAVQGSEALSRLDFVRLEELLQSCAARSRELDLLDGATRKQVQLEAREAVAAMTIFARILEATRANLNVMQRLRDLRLGQLEYGSTPARQFTLQESRHGDH